MITTLGIIVVAMGMALLAVVAIFNRLVLLRQMVRESWSGIDVQLKRRHDLIPNLIETVKGYMAHEQKVLASVTELRAQSINAGSGSSKAAAENQLSAALKTLFAVAEAYPDLKANQSFLELQKNLSDIEDQLQMARRYYNGAVRALNTVIESFPSNLVARKAQFPSVDYFEVESAIERQTPEVKF